MSRPRSRSVLSHLFSICLYPSFGVSFFGASGGRAGLISCFGSLFGGSFGFEGSLRGGSFGFGDSFRGFSAGVRGSDRGESLRGGGGVSCPIGWPNLRLPFVGIVG